jgi:hypothetical protein
VSGFQAIFPFVDFTTRYKVFVTDPDGDPLTFSWSNTNKCGNFTWNTGSSEAFWYHPDPLCPHDQAFHPGTITVIIDDRRGGVVRCDYPGGSASGVNATCTR